jgi:hypothetical protein
MEKGCINPFLLLVHHWNVRVSVVELKDATDTEQLVFNLR